MNRSSASLYACQVTACGKAFHTLRGLLSHMELQHSINKQLGITCGIDGCNNFFNATSSFRGHVRHRHPIHWDSSNQGRRSRGGPGVLTPPLFVSVGVHMHMDPPTFFYSKVHFFSQHYISRCQYLSHLMLNCTNQITNSRSDHNLAIATSARSAPMQWHATRPPEVQSSDSGNNYSHGLSSLPCHS